MSDRYVGAIDQGTTGTRFMVFAAGGDVVARAYETHEQLYPEPGWVEHDPREIWEATRSVIGHALREAGLSGNDLDALGIANQRETTVVWDADSGEPVHNAIVWQDRRTMDRIDGLKSAGKAEEIQTRTGLACDPYFSAPKIEWILENGSDSRGDGCDLREMADDDRLRVGTIDSWLLYKLTGAHLTDVTNASRTMLFNIHDLEWDRYLLEEFGVTDSMLPTVRPSSDPDTYGWTDPEGVLDAAVPVTAVLGDQQASLFGHTCFDEGDAKNTYGTGAFYLMNTGPKAVESTHDLLTTIGYQLGDGPVVYALEGSIFSTGATIEWLEDIGLIEDARRSETLARSVDGTDDVFLVPAFSGLGAPYWDGRARGTIVGLTRGTEKAHLVRAALEATAYQTRDVTAAMTADVDTEPDVLCVDGGAVENDLLCELQADILQTEIHRPVIDETTALGAAYAAGLAADVWESLDDLRELREIDVRFSPRINSEAANHKYDRWLEAVDRSRNWARDG